MDRVLEAVYKNGVLMPLEPLDLQEYQQVLITVHLPTQEEADTALLAWQQVYAGLPEGDIDAIEHIALDRSQFMRQEY